MLSWLSQNLATILITLLLIVIVAAIIISMVRKRKIKSSCSGGCATCPYSSCGCNNHKKK